MENKCVITMLSVSKIPSIHIICDLRDLSAEGGLIENYGGS